MKMITATIYRIYDICKRQVWLFSREVIPNQDDDYLVLGRMIHENSYKRVKKEIVIDGCKFDLMDTKNGKTILGEIKKSSRALESSIKQLKYYLYILRKKGMYYSGEIRVPKEKKRIKVELTDIDIEHIEKELEEIRILIEEELPNAERIKYCSKCAYNEFCWS